MVEGGGCVPPTNEISGLGIFKIDADKTTGTGTGKLTLFQTGSHPSCNLAQSFDGFASLEFNITAIVNKTTGDIERIDIANQLYDDINNDFFSVGFFDFVNANPNGRLERTATSSPNNITDILITLDSGMNAIRPIPFYTILEASNQSKTDTYRQIVLDNKIGDLNSDPNIIEFNLPKFPNQVPSRVPFVGFRGIVQQDLDISNKIAKLEFSNLSVTYLRGRTLVNSKVTAFSEEINFADPPIVPFEVIDVKNLFLSNTKNGKIQENITGEFTSTITGSTNQTTRLIRTSTFLGSKGEENLLICSPTITDPRCSVNVMTWDSALLGNFKNFDLSLNGRLKGVGDTIRTKAVVVPEPSLNFILLIVGLGVLVASYNKPC